MNTAAMAKMAYQSSSRAPLRTPRGTEYEALAKVTHQLKDALTSPFSQLAAALHENRRLWTVLAADVADSKNGLPDTLRAQVFYLAEFTFEHSRKVLSKGEDPSVLIEINTAVMRGLRQSECKS